MNSVDTWGNQLVDNLAGGTTAKLTTLTYIRAVIIPISTKLAIHSLLDRHHWYIGHLIAGPALAIGTHVSAW